MVRESKKTMKKGSKKDHENDSKGSKKVIF